MTRYTRREALTLGASALAIVPLATTPRRVGASAPGKDAATFARGVASGDPDETSVVLWTSVIGATADTEVTWEIATDESFGEVIATGSVTTTAADGYSVHAVVDVPGPVVYRFRSGTATSPIGRAAPAPADAKELRVAAASCQHFESGFYAAHRDITEWSPDLVLFLGDFIYEYGANPTGGAIVRSHEGDEVTTIDAYRARYATYLSDPDLRNARAACPWLVVWDDHEAENNYAALTPEDAADTEGFAARRLAGYQAWWEHMPVRTPKPTADDSPIYRSTSWGGLAKLVMLDGRQYRSDQACNDAVLNVDPPCPEALDPERTMLGSTQERWLIDELASVTQRWAVIGQQTVLTDMRFPNGAIINYDQWDGYAPARDRLLLAAAQSERTIVLTGDIHLAGVGRLPGIGAEFVTTGISSLAPDLPEALVESINDLFPNMVGAEIAHRGYTRHTVTVDRWTAEYRIVDDVTDAASPVSTWRTFAVDAETRDQILEL